MKIQERLKNVKLSGKFENGKLTVISISQEEGEKEFTFDTKGEESDFWDSVMIEGTIFDINLWNNDGEFVLSIYSVNIKDKSTNTETANFMRILLDGQTTEEQTEEFIREQTEQILLTLFSVINLDKPSNFDKILDFVSKEVKSRSDGYMSHGDVIEGFKLFIEQI